MLFAQVHLSQLFLKIVSFDSLTVKDWCVADADAWFVCCSKFVNLCRLDDLCRLVDCICVGLLTCVGAAGAEREQ